MTTIPRAFIFSIQDSICGRKEAGLSGHWFSPLQGTEKQNQRASSLNGKTERTHPSGLSCPLSSTLCLGG